MTQDFKALRRLPIDTDYLCRVLLRLLETASPSGMTDNVVHLVGAELEALGIDYALTRRGAIRANLAGRGGGGAFAPERAIIAHLDTLGAMVKELKPNGRVALAPIGHWSARFAEGTRCTIHSDGLRCVTGTILPLKASGHTYNEEVDTQPSKWTNLEVRIDEDCRSLDDLHRLRIDVGDMVAIASSPVITPTGFINARHLDDKAGVATILAAAKAVTEGQVRLPMDCHLLFTISEEVGVGASAVLHGDVAEMVSIDNGTLAPGQNTSEYGVTVTMMDSAGPFDWHLTRTLLGLCEAHGIEHSRDVFRYYRSDGAAALEAGNDIRTALLCFACDGSHGWERTHVRSLEALAALLTLYMQSDLAFQRDRRPIGPMEDFPYQPFPEETEGHGGG
ncbi:osmoprotectant NAGGN system M42 family peptidase [Novispirillum sp. DQ9]|uniref:osmoprotectant NAGGN system M42 family peptidase n=1 Tax=Novispirillum sp. DQ9 TaxID=3398612 RepID=UPI003C7EB5AF